MDKIRLVTPDHYHGLTEFYTHAINCPECKEMNFATSNFCCGCGIGLKTTTRVKKLCKNTM